MYLPEVIASILIVNNVFLLFVHYFQAEKKERIRLQRQQTYQAIPYHLSPQSDYDESDRTSLSSGGSGGYHDSSFDYGTSKTKHVLNWIPYPAKVSMKRSVHRRTSSQDKTSDKDVKSPKHEMGILGDLPPLEEIQYLEIPTRVPPENSGNLIVALEYELKSETLKVTIESIQELPLHELGAGGGKTNVAVRMWVNNSDKNKEHDFGVRTESHRLTVNPSFHNTFEHHLDEGDVINTSLYFTVVMWQKYAAKKTMAQAILDMMKLESLRQTRRIALPLTPATSRSVGELLVSLCYLPTSARLLVGIMKATGLHAGRAARGESCDPCVRINILVGGKRLWKRKTEIQHNQTNPKFDEMFIFDVPIKRFEKVKFLLVVTDEKVSAMSPPVGEASENEIGRVLIGRNCSVEANVHWDEMRKQPRRPIAQWYTLY